MRNIIFLLIISLMVLVGCRKENLSPSEMLIGKWQLTYIEGTDTISPNSRYEYGTIITMINYDGDPLIINTYKAICKRDTYYNNPPFVCDTTSVKEYYNLIFYLHIYEDGMLKVNEEYKDMDNIPLISQEYSNSWSRIEVGLNHYEFQLSFNPENWPNPKTKIINGFCTIYENDISIDSFTLRIKKSGFIYGEYKYIFTKL